MRTAGWICLIIGVLSFFGAAFKGNSVFGPLFWISLGAFLLYIASNKEQKNDNRSLESEKTANEKAKIQEGIIKPIPENNQEGNNTIPNQQLESLENIQNQLTLQQREAAMCLISFFGGYNNFMDDTPLIIFKQSANFFGLTNSPSELSKIMSKYTDADTLVDIVLTIKPIKAKEFLLLTCYDLIKSSGKSEAFDLLFNIANDMGYNKTRLSNLIDSYQ